MELTIESQEKEILKYLKAGNSLTSLEALMKFGSMRLSARIYNLKQLGHDIKSEIVVTKGKRVAKYFIGGQS